jgi:pyruvate,water dikinase
MTRTLARRLLPWRQAAFGQLLLYCRRYMALRENQRFSFDRLLFRMKRAFERMGALLERDGLLEQGDDIVFFEIDELEALVEGRIRPDEAATLVAARRAEFEANRGVVHPDFLEADEHVPGPLPTRAGKHLTGLGISSGRARGRVRVLSSFEQMDRLQPGEILVTRATDPGWTPLFLVASGLVLELGSVLSHGAVVAREYGLPAVVNVEGATRMLHDGMEVTVDGDRGRVTIHRAPMDPIRGAQDVREARGDG